MQQDIVQIIPVIFYVYVAGYVSLRHFVFEFRILQKVTFPQYPSSYIMECFFCKRTVTGSFLQI